MVFNSYTFIVFFVLLLGVYRGPFSWKTKKIILLVSSYLFYAAWNPPFILLLWLSTFVDFFVGKALYRQQNIYKKRSLLVVSLLGNIGMLCFFKYGGFLLENFTVLVNALGANFHPAKPDIILPAGISFYTFTTLCYTIDMYHRKSEPVRKLLDFSLFVTFFPHLVAGPIVRPNQLVPQFATDHMATKKQLLDGALLLSLGLFMKVVLADSLLATPANTMFNVSEADAPYLTSLDAWTGVFAFSGQIFFDFAGYSTCAIGVALCLGYVLPQNFNYPYAAMGFSDFWRRWHITLSAWLRDYVYIPLGGNRSGKWKVYINVLLTMLIGGLWHGANWTFVVWGGLHGLYLCVERLIDHKTGQITLLVKGAMDNWRRRLYVLFTFFMVSITWVFFRANNFHKAVEILKAMCGAHREVYPLFSSLDMLKTGLVILCTLAAHWWMRSDTVLSVAHRVRWWSLGLTWAVLVLLLIWSQESSSGFIYFQF